jgi:hypothetical protein
MTDYGNTWVSDYPWGWAPFHYGRWVYDGYYGWVWAPDEVWGPAWVDWRIGGGVYGWAPLAPGISISFAFGGGYYCPNDWWVFVPQRYVLSPSFRDYYYGPRYSANYIRSTTVINNTYINNGTTYISGPRAQEIQKATGRAVPRRSISSLSRPGTTSVSGSSVSLYHPRVAASSSGGKAAAPANVIRAEKPIGKPQSLSYNGGKPERLTAPAQQKNENGGGANGMKQQQAQPKLQGTHKQEPGIQSAKQKEQVLPRMEKAAEKKQAAPSMKQERQPKMKRQQPAMKMERQPKMEKHIHAKERELAPQQIEKQSKMERQPLQRMEPRIQQPPRMGRMQQPQMQKQQQPVRDQAEPKHQGGPKRFH